MFKSLGDLGVDGLSCLSMPPIGCMGGVLVPGIPKPVGDGICSSKSAKDTVCGPFEDARLPCLGLRGCDFWLSALPCPIKLACSSWSSSSDAE